MKNGLKKKSRKRKKISFTIVTTNIKYLGPFITKQVKNMYDFKPLKKITEEWKDLPWSLISKINKVKKAILPKAIYRFKNPQQNSNTIVYRPWKNNIQGQYSSSYVKEPLKCGIAKTILYNKRSSGGITTSDFKLYYRAKVEKAVYWYKQTRWTMK